MKRDGQTLAYCNYREALVCVQNEARALRFGDVVKIIDGWLSELSEPMGNEELVNHAKKTMRALGGMEGLGDVGMTAAHAAYFSAVERLHSMAQAVVGLCG